MNQRSKKVFLIIAIPLLVIIILTIKDTVLHEQHKRKKEIMRDQIITVCVGRLLIDLPSTANIKLSSARIAGIAIDAWRGYTETQLLTELREKETHLALSKNDYDQPNLEEKTRSSATDFQTTVLLYGRQKPDVAVEYGKRIMTTQEWITGEAYGIKNNIVHHFAIQLLRYPEEKGAIAALLQRYESREPEKIPQGPGFCTQNGFVHDPRPPEEHEGVTMFASLKGHPDVAIRLDTLTNADKIFESLLSRDANNDVKLEHAANFKTFQSRARTLNGIAGEEVLDKVKERNGTSAHIFTWASMGKPHDVLAPKITLELETGIGRPGEQINSSLSDQEVLELWEQISSSVRFRPTSTAEAAS